MKKDKRHFKFKKIFGEQLKIRRERLGLSRQEISYVLGDGGKGFYNWEEGIAFPSSVVSLNKLSVVFRDIPVALRLIFNKENIRLTKKEVTTFAKKVGHKNKLGGGRVRQGCKAYLCKDQRDTDCRISFGNYLKRERQSRGISGTTLANVFGLTPDGYWSYERGKAFPPNIFNLMLLENCYGNTIDAMFGLCKKSGVRLSSSEKKGILSRLSEVRKLQKSKRLKKSEETI
jgi:transcriptional regulator with XRE-family HTH domain